LKNHIHKLRQHNLWTFSRGSTASGSKKPKVTNANGIKTCWMLIVWSRFLMFVHFVWSIFESCSSHTKIPNPQSQKDQIYTKYVSLLLIHTLGVYRCFFFHRNFDTPKNTKRHISDRIMPVFEGCSYHTKIPNLQSHKDQIYTNMFPSYSSIY
jgi:hypothetical protein